MFIQNAATSLASHQLVLRHGSRMKVALKLKFARSKSRLRAIVNNSNAWSNFTTRTHANSSWMMSQLSSGCLSSMRLLKTHKWLTLKRKNYQPECRMKISCLGFMWLRIVGITSRTLSSSFQSSPSTRATSKSTLSRLKRQETKLSLSLSLFLEATSSQRISHSSVSSRKSISGRPGYWSVGCSQTFQVYQNWERNFLRSSSKLLFRLCRCSGLQLSLYPTQCSHQRRTTIQT